MPTSSSRVSRPISIPFSITSAYSPLACAFIGNRRQHSVQSPQVRSVIVVSLSVPRSFIHSTPHISARPFWHRQKSWLHQHHRDQGTDRADEAARENSGGDPHHGLHSLSSCCTSTTRHARTSVQRYARSRA